MNPKKTITLVEPNEDMRAFLDSELKRRGHTVTSLAKFSQWVDSPKNPGSDLVIMSLGGNKDNALNALRTIRKMGVTTPIIVHSSLVFLDGVEQECLEAGATIALQKAGSSQDLSLFYVCVDHYLGLAD